MLYQSIYPQYKNGEMVEKSKWDPQPSNQIRYPEDIQIIVKSDRPTYGNLYIGNLQAALNINLLKRHQINGILSVAQGYSVKHQKQKIRYEKYVPIPDCEYTDILRYLDDCVEFLSNTLLLTNVLVHCVSGTSKSACVVVAYLIKSKRLSLQDSHCEVKGRRKGICLDKHMMEQLKKYELDFNNTGFRKSRFNMSMRVDTKISNHNVNKSYFETPRSRQQSQESLKTNRNNLNIESVRPKTVQSFRSKTCEDGNKPNIVVHIPKTHTKEQNPEISFQENKRWKTMHSNLLNNSIVKSKAPKALSKVSSIRYISQQQDKISQRSKKVELENLKDLKMSKKTSISRQQFVKKILIIDNRNQQINRYVQEVQQKFEHANQANKISFQNQLNQINTLKQLIHLQYNQRRSKITERSRTIQATQSNNQEKSRSSQQLNQSRISKSNRQYSDLE